MISLPVCRFCSRCCAR